MIVDLTKMGSFWMWTNPLLWFLCLMAVAGAVNEIETRTHSQGNSRALEALETISRRFMNNDLGCVDFLDLSRTIRTALQSTGGNKGGA